jgi:AbrB family looped-hinge helix DNA binding protein
MQVRMTSRGRMVIPVSLRRKLGINPGTRIHVYEEHGKIVLQPITWQHIHKLRSSLRTRRAWRWWKSAGEEVDLRELARYNRFEK